MVDFVAGNLTETNPPLIGAPPSGEPPDGSSSSGTMSAWWSEWNFKVLFGWTNYAVFSTPDTRGSLGTDGGWALYFAPYPGPIGLSLRRQPSSEDHRTL